MTKLELYNDLQLLHNKSADVISQARYYHIRYQRSSDKIDMELAELQDETYSGLQIKILQMLTEKAFADTMDETELATA